MTIEFGALSLSDIQADTETGQPIPTTRRIDEIIGYGILADELGLDRFALGEHHTLDFAVSSPAVVLSAIAQATKTVRLTSAVTVLSVLDPVRLYQDFATLDLISHGRAEIIAGRSAFTEPFPIFGVDLNDYNEIFSEKLALLLELREKSYVDWQGAHRTPLNHAPIAPRALDLPISLGVGGSPESAIRAGLLGLPMILGYIGGPLSGPQQLVRLYRAAGEQAGHPEKLHVGVSTHFFAGETPDAARATFPYYHEYLRPKPPVNRGFLVNRASFEAGTSSDQAIMVGSTDELVEKILKTHELLGIDRFFGQVDWGGLPKELVEESMTRFATEIIPAVKAAL